MGRPRLTGGNDAPHAGALRSDAELPVEPADLVRWLSISLAAPTWERDLEACGAAPHLRAALAEAWDAPAALPALPDRWRSASHEDRARLAAALAPRAVRRLIWPLQSGLPASERRVKLSGYGNSIVVPLAAEFVSAALEAVDETRESLRPGP